MLGYQNGFRKGRSCTDASFTVKLLMEQQIEYNLEMHICFVDLEKAMTMLTEKTYYKFWQNMMYQENYAV